MFYKPSASRDVLGEWVVEILDSITTPSHDRAALDALTASEILDLAYLDSSDLKTAIAAHALFPAYVDQEESHRGNGAASAFEVIFPVEIEDERWGYEIQLRAGRPSMLAIGRGARFPSVNVRDLLPGIMLNPVIDGTRYEIREPNGTRLRTLAGPMERLELAFEQTIPEPSGKVVEQIGLTASSTTYVYLDGNNSLQMQEGENGLLPIKKVPERISSYYLRSQRSNCRLVLEVSWQPHEQGQALFAVALRNLTNPPLSLRARTRASLLSALVLPHLRINLRGARALFPSQQYADAKQQFLRLSEEERGEEAKRRLYQVRQSGCIATINPLVESQVTLTTFGVFDTPREIPTGGPSVNEVTASKDSLLASLPSYSREVAKFVAENWDAIRSILTAAANAFDITSFRLFQWQAIATAIELEATNRQRATTIVRAPTNAGKTVVFMVNAAISSLCGARRSTSVLLFPTRLLNEDMFRRLTAFVYQLRQQLPHLAPTGGILMGTSDPLYRLLLKPTQGEIMYHYGDCPVCGSSRLEAQPLAESDRIIPTCAECKHVIDYMFNPREVTAYLPDIIIATPDKLFYEATADRYEAYIYTLFGAPAVRCNHCGRAYAEAALRLKPEKNQCRAVFGSSSCAGALNGDSTTKPIKYMGFDEVHSLYGETATYLSVFLATLETMQRVLTNERDLHIRYEAATATIANETELLQALTRRDNIAGEIIAIPSNSQLPSHFSIDIESTRQRVLISMPSRVSSREAFIRATLNSYIELRRLADSDLQLRLLRVAREPSAWNFILGYVFRKRDGLDLRRALSDFYRNRFGGQLNIEFLSGEAPKNQISRILQRALNEELDILLANLVVSLGIDIHGLNHMIMFGVPRSFTEYVQTAGRTGRGNSPGHVSIILLPNASRDTYLYRHFHAILSDVAGYYDVLPVRSTNLYCSEEIFGNVAKALLSSLCLRAGVWSNRQGITAATAKTEARLKGAIAAALCNDLSLKGDTERIVIRKYGQLTSEIRSQNKFLSVLMREGEQDWLIYSLRGRSGNTVKVSCSDQLLLELMGKSKAQDGDEAEEETDNEQL